MSVMVGARETTQVEQPPRWDPWQIARAVLLLGVLVLAVATWIGGARQASFNDLRGDIAAGRTHRIDVYGGLPAGAHGSADLSLRWYAGGHANEARVAQSDGSDQSDVADQSDGSDEWTDPDDAPPVVAGDVIAQLTALAPNHDLQVVRSSDDLQMETDLAGWRTPDWVLPAAMVLWLATLVILVNGPEPRGATRWAWFWGIACPLNVVLLPAFLLLGAPWRTGGHTVGRRLTGGWAFFVFFVVLHGLNVHF